MANPEGMLIRKSVTPVLALVLVASLYTRFAPPGRFAMGDRVPVSMLILSTGWCFVVCVIVTIPSWGQSREMGALIAGATLATYPFILVVIAKAPNIRDFFITLFVVGLCLRCVDTFSVLNVVGAPAFLSLPPTLHLSLVSEVALVVCSIVQGLGHIDDQGLTGMESDPGCPGRGS